MDRVLLTVKCWNNQAFIIFVAALGKIPLFFWLFFDCSSSVLSPVPSSEPTDVFSEGSEIKRHAMLSEKVLSLPRATSRTYSITRRRNWENIESDSNEYDTLLRRSHLQFLSPHTKGCNSVDRQVCIQGGLSFLWQPNFLVKVWWLTLSNFCQGEEA